MTAEPISRQSVGLRSERGPVLLAVMLAIALVAIDSTILATAVPSVVSDLGGFSQFPWLFSIYLLATAVTTPLYAKLSDVIGRKPVMTVGIAVFVLGSVLCGVAWSMPALIGFRLLQGLGAGAVQPMGMTIVGDLYTIAERAKVQGYIASVWGVSSVIGPTLGGVFSDYVSWRWIFFVNVPVGIAALVLLRRFSEKVARRRVQVDYAGAILLTTGCSMLILGLLEGGELWAWDSPRSIGVLGAGLVLLVGFALAERRAAEPVLPLWVFGHRTLNGSNAASLVVGVLLIGLTSYVPLYAQSVLGAGALVAGLVVAAMTMGWPIAAAQSGRLYLSIGFRATATLGTVFVMAGLLILLTVDSGSTVLHLAAACFVVGIGLGFIASPALIAAQSAVDWSQRGVVTGSNMFARSVGSAVGIAAFGAIANAAVARRMTVSGSDLSHVPATVLAPAVHDVYLGAAAASLLLLGAVFLMPKHVTPQHADTA